MPELKPCPFCGSTTAPTVMNQNEAQWLDNDAENLSMVVCCAAKKFGCGASTGFCDTAEQAVEAWNRRASDWILCGDRMPDMMADRRPESGWSDDLKPSDYVLCYTNFKRQIVAWYSHAYDEWTDVEEDHTYSRDEITHWMPLPEPPKEVQHVD